MDALASFGRFVAQLIGLGLVLTGAYYALDVFQAVGVLVRDPKGLEGPTAAMATVIDAERLAVKLGDQSVAPGKWAALGCLFGWYVLWCWIPLAIIGAGGRVLYWTMTNPAKSSATTQA